MEQIEFKYQHYWVRAISLIPFIFAAAIIEFSALRILGWNVKAGTFFVLSALIMFVCVNHIFKYIGRYFYQKGIANISSEYIDIEMGRKKFRLKKGIDKAECCVIEIYGVKLLKLVLQLSDEKTVKIYSEDLVGTKECSLKELYYAL